MVLKVAIGSYRSSYSMRSLLDPPGQQKSGMINTKQINRSIYIQSIYCLSLTQFPRLKMYHKVCISLGSLEAFSKCQGCLEIHVSPSLPSGQIQGRILRCRWALLRLGCGDFFLGKAGRTRRHAAWDFVESRPMTG